MRYTQNQNRSLKYILLLAVIFVCFLFQHKDSRREIAGIREPIQTEASGQKQLELGGYQVQISYLYAYDISALVVSTKNYSGSGIGDKLAPKDVALAWGKVAEYNGRINFHWSQSGRWYYWRTDSYEVIEPVGGSEGVTRQSSNNHLIAANEAVKAAIKKIRVGDYIRLNGYLVNVNANKPDGSGFLWNSSTSREDEGAGSCEVIYVTSVEWL